MSVKGKKTVSFSLTHEEYEIIAHDAGARGLTPSGYAKMVLFQWLNSHPTKGVFAVLDNLRRRDKTFPFTKYLSEITEMLPKASEKGGEVVKIRITGCSDPSYWYSDFIGSVFYVEATGDKYLTTHNIPIRDAKDNTRIGFDFTRKGFVESQDCEVIKEQGDTDE